MQIAGVGPTLLLRIAREFGSLAVAWQASESDLLQVEGLGLMTADAIAQARHQLDPAALLQAHERDNPNLWTPADPDYPRLLLEIPDPPPLLYYRGVVDAAEIRGERPAIAIVGTRTPSDYGRRWARRLAKTLVQAGFTLVSGLADGIDTEIHTVCLESGGRTIAVMGTGWNRVYPRSNLAIAKRIDQTGLILSEYPKDTPPDRAHFPRRNRIIAGLCRATIVIEGKRESGAMITARLSNDYNREVYALPGSLDNELSEGCLDLIYHGAQIILSEAHLLEWLSGLPHLDAATPSVHRANGSQQSKNSKRPADAVKAGLARSLAPSASPPPSLDLPPDLDCVFQAVALEPTPLDPIVQRANVSTNEVLSALVQLELMGLVTQLPGMRYQRG
ncbi:MAG: DNA-processing protein DprA [Kaiparowitsia implicata GSE-PSE-MK54-09C]|jgi:DNA processing protein|nr:DNA-processing protein DprA [Kaiparowitsia implicata GSE-PSE-MK54-09C]